MSEYLPTLALPGPLNLT